MATFKNIPDEGHFIRRALPGNHLLKDHDGNVIGFDQTLFRYRSDEKFVAQHGKAETSLSINWIESFDGNADEQLSQTLEDYCQSMLMHKPPIKLGNCHFTKLQVSKFKATCTNYKAKPRVVHDGRPTKSHGGITQLPQDDALLLEDLALQAFQSAFKHKFKVVKKI
jgi:hypothetical protein